MEHTLASHWPRQLRIDCRWKHRYLFLYTFYGNVRYFWLQLYDFVLVILKCICITILLNRLLVVTWLYQRPEFSWQFSHSCFIILPAILRTDWMYCTCDSLWKIFIWRWSINAEICSETVIRIIFMACIFVYDKYLVMFR